jgi:vacuolar protein sorting-associated protein 33A
LKSDLHFVDTQAYGYEHLITLDALERAGLLLTRPSTTKSVYSSLRKALRLIVDEVDEQKPDDIAYVYSGYAPLSIRLVQCIVQKHVIYAAQADTSQGRLTNTLAALPNAMGWRGFEEPLKLVKGRTFDEIQKQEDKAIRAKRMSIS